MRWFPAPLGRIGAKAVAGATSLGADLTRDKRGNIAILSALILPVLIGCLSLGLETGYWYQQQRSARNAADSAAMAAATNGTSSSDVEAQAVAAQYGFVNGRNGVSVTALRTPACVGGETSCYQVTVTRVVPLFLTAIVGFKGDTTLDGGPAKTITATSLATQGTIARPYCVLALASSGAEGITTNGAPKANLAGCNIMSNTSATCHGHNLGADIGDAHGTNSGCGVEQNSNMPVVADPYSGLANNIPGNSCSSYPTNQLSSSPGWSGNHVVCGDLKLTGNVTINNTVLVIENGQLDTGKYTLSGSGLTVVFTGANGSYTHAPTGSGTLDIAAPTSGPWSGVAIYQDPGLTSGVDISAAGNSPTWDITGLVYLPHSSVTFSGAVNKSSNGASCFDLVVDNITINGTGSILAQGQCAQAGLTMPASQIPGRGKLVS